MTHPVGKQYIEINTAPNPVNGIPNARFQEHTEELKLVGCVDAQDIDHTQHRTQQVDKKRVAEHFSTACSSYDQYAQVQKQIAAVNLELMSDVVSGVCKYAVDLGCGTGLHTNLLAKMADNCLAIDISYGMLTSAQINNAEKTTAANKAIRYCGGDVDSLPLQSQCIDVLHSSMALQWCSSPRNAIAEIARVLSTRGSAQLAIMLDSSLNELRQAWQNMGLAPRVNEFFSQKQWLDATQNLKVDKVSSADVQINIEQQVRSFTEWHPSSLHMLRALKRIGAATKSNDTQTAVNSRSSISSVISKQELLELDQQMRRQQAMDEQSPIIQEQSKQLQIGNTDRDQSELPLTYQILFLSIKKSQS